MMEKINKTRAEKLGEEFVQLIYYALVFGAGWFVGKWWTLMSLIE